MYGVVKQGGDRDTEGVGEPAGDAGAYAYAGARLKL